MKAGLEKYFENSTAIVNSSSDTLGVISEKSRVRAKIVGQCATAKKNVRNCGSHEFTKKLTAIVQ